MKTLLKLSLVCSMIGLFLIIFLANHLEPNLINISEIDEKNLEEIVKVQGYIEYIKEYESLTVFSLKDKTGKIDVVFYDDFPFHKNDKIEIIGKVIEYKGKIEIEANKIKFLE